MVGTIMVHGSGGKVLAPVLPGQFLQTKRQDILVTAVSDDEDVPLEVRKELVGIKFSSIFGSKELKGAMPDGSRAAYAEEVAEVLETLGKKEMAKKLRAAVEAADHGNELSLLVFKPGEYEFVKLST